MQRDELISNLNLLLESKNFQDYCPNGLQIEGTSQISKVVCGVSLTLELINQALLKQAQAIIVHHGIFWHKSDYALTGLKYQRVAKLIKNEINLIAYHLPLDNHPELGNNIQLAKLLDITPRGQTGYQNLLWYGELEQPCMLMEFISKYTVKTGHNPIYFGNKHKKITKIAWCSGGAENMFEEAINLGIDLFLTGEVKEPIMSLALESDIAFVAGGHYVTERYGIQALTSYLQKLGISAEFIELYNPV